MELPGLVGDDGDNAADSAELGGLRGGESGGEAIDGLAVGVEELGGVRGRREGSDDGGVPVVVGGEEGGLMRFRHVDDEGLWSVDQMVI